MLTWRDVLVAEERRADALRRAQEARLVRSILKARKQRPHIHDRVLVRVGCWVEAFGRRMQERGVTEGAALTASVRPHEGAC